VTNMSTLGKQKLFEKADLTHSGFDLDPFFFFWFQKDGVSTTHWACFRINVHSTFVSVRTFGKCGSK